MNKSLLAGLLAISLGNTLAVADTKGLLGFYVGEFRAEHYDTRKHPMYYNKINLSVDAIEGNNIKGHSVVAGNHRPFSGTITEKNGVFKIRAKEPGDDQYDGVFEFELDAAGKLAKGTWIANNKKLAVTMRNYELQKRSFRYNPKQSINTRRYNLEVYDSYDRSTNKSEAITPDAWKLNASTTYLKASDVENMYRRDLEVMRNAIYARHGYSFQNRKMRNFFDRQDWYIPVSIDVSNELTDVEVQNIAILKRYENHASTYYDRFGR